MADETRELKVWEDGGSFVIAYDEADASCLATEYGGSPETPYNWTERTGELALCDEDEYEVRIYRGDVAEWIEGKGRCVLTLDDQ